MRDPASGETLAELARLREALAAHLARARRRGVRRVERHGLIAAGGGAGAGSGAAADAAATRRSPAPLAPAGEAATSAAILSAASSSISAPEGPAWRAPWPAHWGSTPERKDEVEARTQAIRARAASAPDLASLRTALAACNACELCAGRTQTVFMDGTGPARVMFVGEAPGYHEDRAGVPFVGAAGQLLTDIIEKGMGLRRTDVVIANVVKCRPPENRDPTPSEKRLCAGWLDRQIEFVNPEVIIGLGRHAAGHLCASDAPIGRLRGKVWERGGRKIVATYHPAYLLRKPEDKKECWRDIQLALRALGLEPPRAGAKTAPNG